MSSTILEALRELKEKNWVSRPGVYTPYVDIKIWVPTSEQFIAWKTALENKKDQLYKCLGGYFRLVQMFSNKTEKKFTFQFAESPEHLSKLDISIDRFRGIYNLSDEDTIIRKIAKLIEQKLDVEYSFDYYFFSHDSHETRRRYLTKEHDYYAEDEYYRYID